MEHAAHPMQPPRMADLPEKKLVGMHLRMSYADDKTPWLWRNFMPRRKEIAQAIPPFVYSLQVYDTLFSFTDFGSGTLFEKWACVEVPDFEAVPEGMDTLVVPAGLYAVFIHHGPASEFARTWHYIFNEWLPQSDYQVDHRPHFEAIIPGYRPDDPEAQEEVWIPIRKKDFLMSDV